LRKTIAAAALALSLSLTAAAPALAQDASTPPATEATANAAVAPELPAVEGVEWLPIAQQTGEEIESSAPASAVSAWEAILGSLGLGFEDLTVDVRLAAIEGSELDYGAVLIARLPGVAADDLRTAFRSSVPRAMPIDAVITPTTMAGREVLLVEVPPDYRLIYHYADGAAYQLDLAPEIEQAVLAALP
jgi:hypothetical protein